VVWGIRQSNTIVLVLYLVLYIVLITTTTLWLVERGDFAGMVVDRQPSTSDYTNTGSLHS
jgi:hypothetical protein